jgi:hypothetical protein
MLAENFLDQGFLDLLWPLENHQVAPIGFLWIELACVRALGFSEWSLRLFPLLCGIGSLFVFRHVAARLLAGIPLVLAVGCLAVAKAPSGLSANAKPYACDLFVAVVLLALAVEWLRRPDRTTWLWGLAAALPLAFALSFPAVFVAGAISLALVAPAWRCGQRRTWCAFAAYHVSLGVALAAFAGMIAAPVSSVYPGMGTQVLIICFVVVVIGGIGSIWGALFASLLIGLADTFGKVLVPEAAGVTVYLLMAAILLWRPEGLFKRAG